MKKYQHPALDEIEFSNKDIIMLSFEVAGLFNGDGEGESDDVDSYSASNWK